MAASQNARSGSTPKTHRRSRPPIQTCDPDRSRPHDPDRSRPMIQTPSFYVGWKFSFSKYWKVLPCTTKYYSSNTLYCKVLLCTTKYDAGWSREFWKNLAMPFQTSFQTVPDPFQTSSMESKNSVHAQPCCQEDKTGLCAQCRIIWFSLSIWNGYHDSRHSVPDVRKRHFTKVVVPDVRIIAERSRPVYRPIAIYVPPSHPNTSWEALCSGTFEGPKIPSQQVLGCPGVVEKVKFLKPYQPKKLTWQRKITIFMRRYTFHFLSC